MGFLQQPAAVPTAGALGVVHPVRSSIVPHRIPARQPKALTRLSSRSLQWSTGKAVGAASSAITAPVVTLFTKAGCTLCDKALDVLQASGEPFELQVVDIGSEGNEDWRARYWCDIPVFHVNGEYWAKHKLAPDDVDAVLQEAAHGSFEARNGEPDSRGLPEPDDVEICGDECCGGPCRGCHEPPATAASASFCPWQPSRHPRGILACGLPVASAFLWARRRGRRRGEARVQRRAGPGSADFFSGEVFSRRAVLVFESEKPLAANLIILSILVTAAGLLGLLFNVAGQVALLTTPGSRPGMDSAQGLLIQALATVLGGAGFLALNNGRTSALKKLDSEFAFGVLQLKTSDGLGITHQLSAVKGKQRVVVVFGEGEALQAALLQASAYRRRWETSQVIVVHAGPAPRGLGGKWLAEAQNPQEWVQCFDRFSKETDFNEDSAAKWVLFGLSGRMRGRGPAGDWDQVLAFVGVKEDLSLRSSGDVEVSSDEERTAVQEVLRVHDEFYAALKDGNTDIMRPLWMTPKVQESEAELKRRVPWDSVLSEPAEVLDVVDVDVVFTGEGTSEATVTSIEVCKGQSGLFNEGGPGGKGTLLATKVLRRDPETDGQFRLVSHQTIPYCSNTIATQSLRCNANGCTLLKRD